MKRQLAITKGTMLSFMNFRFSFIASLVLNFAYVVFSYYLWRAIYTSAGMEEIRGLRFEDAFLFMTMAFITNTLFRTQVDWKISSSILSGNIVVPFLRPITYQSYVFFDSLGSFVLNFFTIFAVSMIAMLSFVSLEITNSYQIVFFFLSMFLSYMISFHIDFAVGLVAFYTESIWGVMVIKNVVISFLGGILFPLAFLPDMVVEVLQYSPIYAMYQSPIFILTGEVLGIEQSLLQMGMQLLWWGILILFNKMLYQVAVKKLTVNGG